MVFQCKFGVNELQPCCEYDNKLKQITIMESGISRRLYISRAGSASPRIISYTAGNADRMLTSRIKCWEKNNVSKGYITFYC